METNGWETRMEAVEDSVRELRAALLGTLDGRPGLRSQMDAMMSLMKQHSEVSARNSEQLTSLQLDRAKVWGIVITVSAVWGILLGVVKLLHL